MIPISVFHEKECIILGYVLEKVAVRQMYISAMKANCTFIVHMMRWCYFVKTVYVILIMDRKQNSS